MKKIFVLNIIVVWFFLGYSLLIIWKIIFCVVSPNAITVTIEKENNYKCSTYLDVLSQAISKEYKDFGNTRYYWTRVRCRFWTTIRNDKIERIKILLVREQIEEAVISF